ncbi:Zinc finger protein 850 [Lucilia cuprina]|nr:Zinc finger protein 850 [Lucilia cuprina]
MYIMENVCRTCMLNIADQLDKEQDINEIEMISIFIESKMEKLSLKELIKTAVPQIKIEENDQLPKSICQKCLDKIREIYNFQQKCVNIEEKFYKMLEEGDLSDSPNNIDYLEEQLIKTEMINSYLSEDNSMDYNNEQDRFNEDEISRVDTGNNSIDILWQGSGESDCLENQLQSKSKDEKKANRSKRKKKENTTKNEKPREKLKSTSRRRKDKSNESEIKEMYPCGKCQRKLISKLSFIKHQEMHLRKDREEQELKCSICNLEFSEKTAFKNHQQTHTAEKTFLCSQCGKGFASAGSLKQHSLRHLDKKLYPCTDCPKSFPTKNDLLCHYEIHKAKPRIHVCDVCGRGFHKQFLLKQHQRYHNDERPFACEFCEKRFVTSEKQQRHMRTHTHSNDCIKHLRQHLGDNVYMCELCPLRFPLARDLRAHFASHKDDDDETRARNLKARKQQEMANKNKVKMKTPQMVSIFTVPEEAKEKLNLMELIKTTVPQLKIDENDQLPKNVCVECSEKIKEMYNFQQTCLSNEHKFYKMLEGDDDAINPFNDTEDHEDVFKTEFDDSFIEENSLQTDEEMIMEEEINRAAEAKEEFIESYSDCSIDLVWDDDNNSDADWNEKKVTSKTKKTKHSKTQQIDDDRLKDAENITMDNAKRHKVAARKQKCIKENPLDGQQKFYPCNKCKRKLKTELSFKKHQEMHDSKEHTYKCSICKQEFEDKSSLKDHMRTHSGEKVFLCPECGKGYTTAGGLKEHSYRHLSEKNFQCPDCPRSFTTKSDLVSHHIIHKAKPKNHICDICGRGFHKPFLLKKHKMYHNNDRPFACEFCEKRFITNEKLQRHVRIHTGEKPYKCNYCEKAYCQSNELTKHLRIHLGDNVYQCELCPLRFPTCFIMNSTTITLLENFCRTCMNGEVEDEKETKDNKRKTISIFNEPQSNECKNITIMELLMLTTPQLTIETDDMLPKTVCENCLERLVNAHAFQQMCIKVEEKFRQMIKDDKPAVNSQIITDPLIDNILKIEIDEALEQETALESKNLKEDVEDIKFEKEENHWEDYSDSEEFCDVDSDKDSEWESSNVTKSKKGARANSKKVKEEKDVSSSEVKDLNDIEDKKDNITSEKIKESKKNSKETSNSKDNESKSFVCDECGNRLSTRKSLKRHKRIHLRPADSGGETKIRTKYECEVCKKVFQQSSSLKDHMRIHTGEQPYLCSECGKAFKSLSNMKQHFLRHGTDRPYVCQHCPKRFPCLSDLASHKVVHNKIKSHICDICGAGFTKPYLLKKHKMYHTGERNHKCDYCDMRFVLADQCRRHMRTHTGEKPYKCKYCERAFAQSNDLIKHMRGHIGDNVYKCDLCPQGFRLQCDLRAHFYTHKDDDEETRARNLEALKEEERRLQAKFGLVGST